MTARYVDDWSARSRPAHPDHGARWYEERHTPPDECQHPVEARVSAKWRMLPNGAHVRPLIDAEARCHDCLLWLRDDGTWVRGW